MPKKLPKSLDYAQPPRAWHGTHRFSNRTLRVTSAESNTQHFCGGSSPHSGTKCRECKKPLTLLWDIALDDPLIPDFLRAGFAPATRLPFYICWRCVAASYSVLSDTKISTFEFDCYSEYVDDGESPFEDTPGELDRRPIALTQVPSTVDALLSLARVIDSDALDQAAQKTLSRYFHKNFSSRFSVAISQIGGEPAPYQGHRNTVCPNPKCPASSIEHPYSDRDSEFLMRELALIDWMDEPVLAEHCFQLLYSMCGVCFSVRAEYRCT